MDDDIKKNIANLKPSATLAINEKVKQLLKDGKKVFNFGFGQSPFPIPEKIVSVLRDNAHKKDYLPMQGLPELREAISKYLLKRTGVDFKKENIEEKVKLNHAILGRKGTHFEIQDRYSEIGKLVKEARIKNNLSVKDLSIISKIPESSINSIENNIKNLRPGDPFIRSILFKLEKSLYLKNNTLVGLRIKDTNTFDKNKNNFLIRKVDFLNSWQGIVFYFLFLIFILFILNRYFISNINVIEIQIIEEKIN